MADSFTHLHVHTEYSMLDGAARLDELVAAAAADGQPALGITDHGNMYGILDFYRACKDRGVKPILGTEAYMAHDHRTERIAARGKMDDSGGEGEGGRKPWYHLTLLAENETGYKNLIQLASRSFMEGYYRKPKVDWELLEEHSEGLIATTGCLGGHVLQAMVPKAIMDPDKQQVDHLSEDERFDNAVKLGGRLQDIFGRDNLFVEIQDHGIPAQQWSNPRLAALAKAIRAPLLATNDSHYVHRDDAKAHDALLCVQTASMVSDTNRFKFHGDDHYLKSADEMRYLFRELPTACDNTLWVAERCDVEIEFGKPQLPSFPLPPGFDDDDEYLRHLVFEGAEKRWGKNLDDKVTERLIYELQVIRDMGFSSYFIITWDLIKHARDNDIRVGPGRGSAAGCAVAYTLWITDLDPIEYDLLFERFLNPSRISMPDIDMDFDTRYRDEMIRYCAERYGRENVAQIITFGTIKARQAVRDAARVLGHDYGTGDRIAKAVPPLIMGRDTPLYACFEEHPKYTDGYKMATEIREMYDADPVSKEVIDVAKGLEGLRRSDGIHAAAVVITKEPLTTYLPIQRKPEPGKPLEEAPVVTQYEMHGVEDLGLLKMDFLGLRNLDIISDALQLISEIRGVELDIDNVDLTDEPTYELLRAGKTIGVFQLESPPMRALMRSLAPTEFEDVAALVALYRPGPMAANMHNDYADRKNGRKKIEYLHPDAEEILGSTYGLMIYQESVMRIAQKFAGFSLADADNLRKACGKKVRELIVKEREKFVAGCDEQGYGRELGDAWFDIIEPFADYAFNKSHSYGYGFIAYQIAYLKANYPAEYMSALLTSVKSNLDKAAVYLAECRSMGIPVTVADVNRSWMNFAPEIKDDGSSEIIFGLSAVRGVGTGLVQLILEERDANGPFQDFYDFCERVDTGVLNKKTIEALIKAGAFDAVGHKRQGLLMVFESIIDHTIARRKETDAGIQSLFGGDMASEAGGVSFDEREEIPDTEFPKTQKLAFEKEMLGLYVSDHPLFGAEDFLARRTDGTLSDLTEMEDGAIKTFGGVITTLQRKWTKKGDLMAVFVLEDLGANAETMVFPRTMTEHGHKLDDDAIVLIRGKVDKRDDIPKLIAMDVDVVEGVSDVAEPFRIAVTANRLTAGLIDQLKELLLDHPGDHPVLLHLGADKVLRLPPAYGVDAAAGLMAEIRVLLGPDSLVDSPPGSTDPG
ncbi:MAG: DNA polymerase III subunit alpha [Acidimicrobiales bacterium]|nr:DNA polymerase III subunit alpha [Acidimicrobiales bacterium]